MGFADLPMRDWREQWNMAAWDQAARLKREAIVDAQSRQDEARRLIEIALMHVEIGRPGDAVIVLEMALRVMKGSAD